MKVMLRGMVAGIACTLVACGGAGAGTDFSDDGQVARGDAAPVADAGAVGDRDANPPVVARDDAGEPLSDDAGPSQDDGDASPAPTPTTTSTGNPPPPPVDAGHDAAPPVHGCMTTNGLYTVNETSGAVSCSSPSSAFPCSTSSGLTPTYVAFVDGQGNLVGSYPSPPVKHICDPPGGSCVVHGVDGQGHAATMYDGVCQ